MNLQGLLDWTAEMAGCDAVPADSQVYVEAPGDVRRVLFGIDMTLAEVVWAQANGFDAVVAHHPLGDRTRLRFAEVVYRQDDMMVAEGVPHDVAVAAVDARLDAMQRATHMANVNALVDGARLVGMPLCNVHLACDILTRNAIIDTLRGLDEDATVGVAIESLVDRFAEFRHGHAAPEAWLGADANRLGRWVVAIAGGTNGGYPVFSAYYDAGVDTVVTMHCAEDQLQTLRAATSGDHTLLVTGHMTADSIGINMVIAAMEARGIEVVRTSGVVAPA